MKKHLLVGVGLTLTALTATAQQKIKDGSVKENNLPNKDAMLEIESTRKGLLHSRVELKSTKDPSPLSAHSAGMMVYNTATVADVVPGIYYNDGTKWVFGSSEGAIIKVENQPGKTGTPGTPGQPGGPGAGTTVVNNDAGTWVYNPTTNEWTNIKGPKGDPGVVGVQGITGIGGTPGKPGSGEAGAPGEGVTIVNNDSGTWVYDPSKGTWTNIKGPKGDPGVVGVQGITGIGGTPGKPGSGEAGAPGEGVTIVNNDSGTWVYDPSTGTWTNIKGPKGDPGVVGVQGLPGTGGTPGTPGSGTPGAPGEGITIVTNDSGTWVYNPTTKEWTNINGKDGISAESMPGTQGEPGIPGSGTAGAPGEGVQIVTNDSGTWVYNPLTKDWININGKDGIGVESMPGKQGEPGIPGSGTAGAPGEGIQIVTNDSGTWVYNPTTKEWTNINGKDGVSAQSMPGTKGEPGIPGSGTAGAPGEGVQIVTNDSGTWVYNPLTKDWTNINGKDGVSAQSMPGTQGEPGIPGSGTVGAPGEGVTIVTNDSGTWVYNPLTKEWTNINGKDGVGIEGMPGKTGEPGIPGSGTAGAPGEGVQIVTNDSGTWVYNPTTKDWTLIKGEKGDKGDPGTGGGSGNVQGMPGMGGEPGTPGSGTADAPEAGIVAVVNDSGTWIYDDGTDTWTNVSGKDGIGVESMPGKQGEPGIPGSGTVGAPGEGVTIVTNDSGTWVYNPLTKEWTNINGKDGIGIEGMPGKTGEPGIPGSGTAGAPGEGVQIVTNDSGTWVYNPTTKDWTLIKGEKGDKGDPGAPGVIGVQDMIGKTGEPGIPGSGTAGAPGEGITIVNNDSGTWVYNPTTKDWTNIKGPKGDKGDPGTGGGSGNVQGMPGMGGEPGTPGSGTADAPEAGIVAVVNDSGTWIYDDATDTWTLLNGTGDGVIVQTIAQPGEPGIPGSGTAGAPGEGVNVVINDSGVWVYDPATKDWTNIKGPKGDKGDPGAPGVIGVQDMIGKTGEPGIPGSGTAGAPGEGITIVNNDSGTWVYNPTTKDWTNIKGPKGDKGDPGTGGGSGNVQGMPGMGGEPGIPGSGTADAPEAGIVAVVNDSGTWIYDDGTDTWTLLNGTGDGVIVQTIAQPGEPGIPGSGTAGAPGEGVNVVINDSGVWVYDPATKDWTNIKGPKGDKGDPGAPGVIGVQDMIGKTGEPGIPGSGTAGAPGEGITIVNNDSGTWVYNPTTKDWTNIKGPKGDKGDPGTGGGSGNVQGMPGMGGEPGTPGSGTADAPEAGIVAVVNDSGTWIYDDGTDTWTLLNGTGDGVIVQTIAQPGEPGIPGSGTAGAPGEGVNVVINDSGVWVYDPATKDWTNIKGPKGDKGDPGAPGVIGVQDMIGKTGEPGIPGSGTAGAPGEGITIVNNDSGTWVYNPTTKDWTNIKGPKGDKGDPGTGGGSGNVQGMPGMGGEPGTPGSGTADAPEAGIVAVVNDSGTWIYDDGTDTWTLLNGTGDGVIVQTIAQPGEPGIPGSGTAGAPGEGVNVVINDSGVWVYDPATKDWTNIKGPKGDKGDPGAPGVIGVQDMIGKTGEPGIPGSGTAGAPGEGITIVNNDSGTWVYNPTTKDWTNIKGDKGDPGTGGGSGNVQGMPGMGGEPGTPGSGTADAPGAGVVVVVNDSGTWILNESTNSWTNLQSGEKTTVSNGNNTTVTATVVGGVTDYKVNINPATGSTIGGVKPGAGLVIDATGTLSVSAAPGVVAEDLTSTDLDVVNGNGSTLKDVTLNIKNGAIVNSKLAPDAVTSDKIKDGEIKAADLASAGNNQILTTNASGAPTWVDQSTLAPAVNVSNTSNANDLTTTVNGQTSTAVKLVNSNGLTLDAGNKLVSTVNGVATTPLDLTPAIQAGQKTTTVSNGSSTTVTSTVLGNVTDYKVNISNATATTPGAVKPGTGLTIDANGTLSVSAAPGVTGKDLTSTDLTISDGSGVVLKDVTIDIKSGAVTSDKIKDGEIKAADLANAGNNQVLTTNASGAPTWVDQSTLAPAVNVSNTSNANDLTTTVNGQTSTAVKLVNSNGLTLDAGNKLVSTVNGVATTPLDLTPAILAAQKTTTVANGNNTTVTSTVTGNVTEYKVSTANATASTPGAVKPGTGLTIDADGTLSVSAAPAVTGKNLTSTDLTVTNGDQSVLKDVTLDIKENAITNAKLAPDAVTSDKIKDAEIKTADLAPDAVTSDKIKDGEIKAGDLASAGSNQVLTTNASGAPIWVDQSAIAPAATEPWFNQTGGTQATANTQNIYQMGSVAIGATTIPSFTVDATVIAPKFHVQGDISTTGKIWTANSVYADYVFEKYFNGHSDIKTDYQFRSLEYVKDYIKKYSHLPGVRAINDLKKASNGYTFDMTELSIQSLEKIEELYLHTIEQKEKIDKQQAEIEEMKARLAQLEKLLLKNNQ